LRGLNRCRSERRLKEKLFGDGSREEMIGAFG
jgi:hypothetical protein